jgi:peptidoglycan/LPS O-acetylase OafA/YrhL
MMAIAGAMARPTPRASTRARAGEKDPIVWIPARSDRAVRRPPVSRARVAVDRASGAPRSPARLRARARPRRDGALHRLASTADRVSSSSAASPNDDAAAIEPPSPSPSPSPPAKKKRAFIPALDSTRFFLITYIAVGHFIACCTKDPLTLRMLSQVNVVVGAFFVLSGYVVAYTCTELGEYRASPRISPAPAFILSRVMGYYPLYLLAQVVFGWVFVYADNLYNGPIATVFHGLITMTLTQAWFPAHAELWNAPTWFLSALTFATVALPFCLPSIASWKKKGLKTAMIALTAISLIAKVAYSYDTGGWFFMEGVMSPKTHPSWLFWNAQRFSPFAALVEILIGCVAARSVMVRECADKGEEKGVNENGESSTVTDTDTNNASGWMASSPVVPLLGMAFVLIARGFEWLTLNDGLTRGLFFIPLFVSFIKRIHVQTVYVDLPNAAKEGHKSFSTMMSHKWLTYLGAISFPIYILHGPIGQIFYKRAVASKLWGTVFTKYPEFFPAYLAIVLLAAVVVHEKFMKNKAIQGWFQERGQAIAAKF